MALHNPVPTEFIQLQVQLALSEDIGHGDLTASLTPENAVSTATLISRQAAILCGQAWFDEVFKQLDSSIRIEWLYQDGDNIAENAVLCRLTGPSRTLLTGERTAMNFLQTLSGTATLTAEYIQLIADLPVQLLDTRKTLPGLRLAQKYAVLCGGGHNHRFGLYDAILIKENHISAAGSITAAVEQARALHPEVSIQVEVENLDELSEAITVKADKVLLDNFSLALLKAAVSMAKGKVLLEASGGVNTQTLRAIAETGVDRISVGQLTKDVKAIDLSMRFNNTN